MKINQQTIVSFYELQIGSLQAIRIYPKPIFIRDAAIDPIKRLSLPDVRSVLMGSDHGLLCPSHAPVFSLKLTCVFNTCIAGVLFEVCIH